MDKITQPIVNGTVENSTSSQSPKKHGPCGDKETGVLHQNSNEAKTINTKDRQNSEIETTQVSNTEQSESQNANCNSTACSKTKENIQTTEANLSTTHAKDKEDNDLLNNKDEETKATTDNKVKEEDEENKSLNNSDVNGDANSSRSSEGEKFYTDAADYWETVPANIEGMLGGFGHISSTDIGSSFRFLRSFIIVSFNVTMIFYALMNHIAIG